jgi:hypothetical protein
MYAGGRGDAGGGLRAYAGGGLKAYAGGGLRAYAGGLTSTPGPFIGPAAGPRPRMCAKNVTRMVRRMRI